MPICSVSSRQCYDDGKEFAEQALVFDQAGDIAAAIFYYTEAANVLLTAINVDPRLENLNLVLKYFDRVYILVNSKKFLHIRQIETMFS